MTLVLATVRGQIADYVGALVTVYALLIIAYILSSLFFALRRADALRALVERACSASCATSASPTWRIFRRFIPPIGPLDLSPIVAIIVLTFVGRIVAEPDRGLSRPSRRLAARGGS